MNYPMFRRTGAVRPAVDSRVMTLIRCPAMRLAVNVQSQFNRGPHGLVVLHKSVRFPPGLSRRDHNWLATKAAQDISLSVGPVPAGATIELART